MEYYTAYSNESEEAIEMHNDMDESYKHNVK